MSFSYCGTPERERRGKKKKKNRKNKPYCFQPKIAIHAIAKTFLMTILYWKTGLSTKQPFKVSNRLIEYLNLHPNAMKKSWVDR